VTPADLLGAVILAALVAYALLAGADFGGGVWDLLANVTSLGALSLPGPWRVLQGTWNDRGNLGPAMWTTSKEAVLGVAVAVLGAFVLAVAVAFLLRLGLARGLSRIEIGGLAAAGALILIWGAVTLAARWRRRKERAQRTG